jgi:xanthine dehydrogenase large subunit
MGWLTTENLVYDKEGLLISHSPSTYKIPSIQDTPRIFNVTLAHNLENHVNIRGTKAAGEPPLLLALSVWTAVKDAIRYESSIASSIDRSIENATKQFNQSNQLPIPATAECTLRHLKPLVFASFEESPAPQGPRS